MLSLIFGLAIFVAAIFSAPAQSMPGHWSLVFAESGVHPNTLAFYDSSYGILLLDSSRSTLCYRTVDGGSTWSKRGETNSVTMANGFVGVARGLDVLNKKDFYDVDGGASWVSHDSGASWDFSFLPLPDISAMASKMFSPAFGITVAGYPNPSLDVLETYDSATTFEQRSTFPNIHSAVADVFFLDSSTWLLALNYAKLLRTRDGGLSWDTVFNPPQPAFYGQIARSADPSHIYVTGGLFTSGRYSASYFESSDAGNSWRADSSIFGNRISQMVSPAFGVLWCLVNEGRQSGNLTPADSLFYTSNDGRTWAAMTFPDTLGLWSIVFPDSSHGYLMGYHNDTTFVYRTITEPSSVIEDWSSDPRKNLFVSYFPSPASDIVHLKMLGMATLPGRSISAGFYDILGREVLDISGLANRGNNGSFSEFDANVSGLPPGPYLIRYTVGGYSFSRSIIVFH